VTIDGFNFTSSTTNSSNHIINWPTLNVGGSLVVKNNVFTFTGGSGAPRGISEFAVLTAANSFIVKNNKFYGTGTQSGLTMSGLIAVDAGLIAENTFFNLQFATGCNTATVSAMDCYYNTYSSCPQATGGSGKQTHKNELYVNNTDDVSISGSASAADFSYCGFGQDSGAGMGTGVITGLNYSRELCDKTMFFISPASQTRGLGVSISGLTGVDVIDGVKVGLDMGYSPYSLAHCGGYGAGK